MCYQTAVKANSSGPLKWMQQLQCKQCVAKTSDVKPYMQALSAQTLITIYVSTPIQSLWTMTATSQSQRQHPGFSDENRHTHRLLFLLQCHCLSQDKQQARHRRGSSSSFHGAVSLSLSGALYTCLEGWFCLLTDPMLWEKLELHVSGLKEKALELER